MAKKKDGFGKMIYRSSILLVFLAVILVGLGIFCGPVVKAKNKAVKVTQKEIETAVSLQERETIIAVKEKEISRRESELAALKKDVDEKLDRLTALQKDIQNRIDEYKVVQDKPFRDLVKIYSAMSASKVAPLLNQMEDKTVARILRAMKTEAVSKIVPKLQPDKAVRVSKALGRIE